MIKLVFTMRRKEGASSVCPVRRYGSGEEYVVIDSAPVAE
jgi:hypothetical protein